MKKKIDSNFFSPENEMSQFIPSWKFLKFPSSWLSLWYDKFFLHHSKWWTMKGSDIFFHNQINGQWQVKKIFWMLFDDNDDDDTFSECSFRTIGKKNWIETNWIYHNVNINVIQMYDYRLNGNQCVCSKMAFIFTSNITSYYLTFKKKTTERLIFSNSNHMTMAKNCSMKKDLANPFIVNTILFIIFIQIYI